MLKRLLQVFAVLLVAGFVYLNVDYWQDPAYWRRWWDLVTHPQADRMNFSPVTEIQSHRTWFPPRAPAGEESIDPRALDEAQSWAGQQGSFAFIVVHHGQVQREWYADGWQRDRLTQSQSMMKTLTALMVGLAIEDGHIGSVQDSLSRYFPEWRDDPRGEITLEQLLLMSSGLAQYRFTLNPFARDSSFRFLNSSDRIPILLSTPLEWQPGSRFDYNDVDAQLAGLLVERAVGRDYASYFQQRFWDPLGGQYAELWLDREGGLAMTACCLLASPLDWAKIGMMMLNEGRLHGRQVVPAAWIARMLEPSEQYPGYGYFTWLGAGLDAVAPPVAKRERQSTEPFLAKDLFILSGYGGQRVYVSRQYDLVVVRLGPFAGMQPLPPTWDNSRLINTVIRGIRD